MVITEEESSQLHIVYFANASYTSIVGPKRKRMQFALQTTKFYLSFPMHKKQQLNKAASLQVTYCVTHDLHLYSNSIICHEKSRFYVSLKVNVYYMCIVYSLTIERRTSGICKCMQAD